jgi:hypothetical protein
MNIQLNANVDQDRAKCGKMARERDQLLAEIWGGETAEQNVPEKIEGEPEHDRCEPAVAQKKPALEYVGEIKRLHR